MYSPAIRRVVSRAAARLESDHRIGRAQRVPGLRIGGPGAPGALLAVHHDPDGNPR